MTEPEEEEVKAPLDSPDEDEVKTARTLDTISSLEDLETPKAPDEVSEAVEEAIENDEEETEVVDGEEEAEEHIEPEPEPEIEPEIEPEPDTEYEPPQDGYHSVKINGEEYQLSIDDLVAGYQQAAASQQKFQRASEVEKAARTVIDNVLNPDTSVDTMIDLYTDQMGGDRNKATEMVDDIIGKRIQYLIDLEEMSEDERRVHDLEGEKQRMAIELEQHQQVQYARQQEEYVNYQNNQAVPLLDRAISAYNLDVGSAQDQEASNILAEYIKQGHTITQELANQTVAEVINRRAELLQNTLSGMTAEELAMTNPGLASQIQQRRAEEIQASRTTQTGASPQGSTSRRRKAKKTGEYTDSNEFFNDTDF